MLRAKACLTAQVRLLLVLEDSAQVGTCVFGTQACFTYMEAAVSSLPMRSGGCSLVCGTRSGYCRPVCFQTVPLSPLPALSSLS